MLTREERVRFAVQLKIYSQQVERGWLLSTDEEPYFETPEEKLGYISDLGDLRRHLDTLIFALQEDTDPAIRTTPLADHILKNADKLTEGTTPEPWALKEEVPAPDLGEFPYEYKVNRRGKDTFVCDSNSERGWADANLIAESRRLIPLLVQEVKHLRAVNNLLHNPPS